MYKCPQCNVILYNNTNTCPLCNCVAQEMEEEEVKEARAKFGENAPYPDIHGRHRVMAFILKVVLFLFIVAEAIMVYVNYRTSWDFKWSLITGLALGYTYGFLSYWVRYDTGFAAKVGLQTISTIALLLLVDNYTGQTGWSLEWAIPGMILVGDLIVMVLMLVHRHQWYSYLLLLLLMGLCSIGVLVLYLMGVTHNRIMPVMCIGVTGIYILGALIFGSRAMKQELGRRFHV